MSEINPDYLFLSFGSVLNLMHLNIWRKKKSPDIFYFVFFPNRCID